jgi:hypothetical protein
MMSLTQWQKLTARITAKAVPCAEVWLAVAGAATAFTVVSVKAFSEILGGRFRNLKAGCRLIRSLPSDFFRGLVQ